MPRTSTTVQCARSVNSSPARQTSPLRAPSLGSPAHSNWRLRLQSGVVVLSTLRVSVPTKLSIVDVAWSVYARRVMDKPNRCILLLPFFVHNVGTKDVTIQHSHTSAEFRAERKELCESSIAILRPRNTLGQCGNTPRHDVFWAQKRLGT